MTRKSDRDRSVEELLRRSLRAREASPDGESCLDAEMLAAWVDARLSAKELSLAEAHLADCARCQAMVAAIGMTSSANRVPEPWWRRDWGLKWLVPLTAGAAAIALWIAVPRETPTGGSPAPLSQSGRVQAPAAGVSSSEASAPVESVPVQPAEESERRTARRPDLQVGREGAEKQEARAESGPTPTDSVSQLAGSARAAAPAPSQAAESAAGNRERMTILGLQASAAGMIASPDPKILWRIGAGGSVQHSTNGGASWEELVTGVTVDLAAGSAPSASVCWLVGRAGTVLRTTDARSWQRVAFPEAVDLTAVQAIDDRTASVTATDGRVFRTTDGGSTWNLVSRL